MPRKVVVSALACVFAAGTVYAQDDNSFKQGIQARKDKKWPAVAPAMRAAIAADAVESTRKVAGGFRSLLTPLGAGDVYLPHFYLGEALFNQDDCPGALNAWEESDRQGVLRKDKDKANAAVIDGGYAACEKRGFLPPPRFAKELQEAREVVRAAANAAQRLNEFAAANAEARGLDWRSDADNGQSQLQTATGRLDSGERTRRAQDFVDARAAADASVRAYRAARERIDKALELTSAFGNKVRDVEADVLAAEKTWGRDLDAMVASSPVKVALSDTAIADRGRALDALARARDRIRAASRSHADADLIEAARLTQEAIGLFGQVRGAIDNQIRTGVDRELRALQSTGGDGFAAADARVRVIGEAMLKRPLDPQVAKDFAAVEKSLTRARQNFDQAIRSRDLVGARTAAATPPQLIPPLDGIVALLGLDRVTLPDALRNGAQALFDGRYAEALTLLTADAAAAIEMPFKTHAHLVRAAALFALYEYSGATDTALLSEARRESSACRSLDAGFRPNAAAFSPRFIAFFLGEAKGGP